MIRVVLKHELYQRCLEAKGYQLVPDESGDGTDADTGGASNSGVSSDPEGATASNQLDVEQSDAPRTSQAQPPGAGEPAR